LPPGSAAPGCTKENTAWRFILTTKISFSWLQY
jgi:hypothetical protein